jgi:hypothetical protein
VADNTYQLSRPYDSSARIPSVSAVDTGVVVDAILKGGKKYHGKSVAIYSEWISEKDKLRTWAECEFTVLNQIVLFIGELTRSDRILQTSMSKPNSNVSPRRNIGSRWSNLDFPRRSLRAPRNWYQCSEKALTTFLAMLSLMRERSDPPKFQRMNPEAC